MASPGASLDYEAMTRVMKNEASIIRTDAQPDVRQSLYRNCRAKSAEITSVEWRLRRSTGRRAPTLGGPRLSHDGSRILCGRPNSGGTLGDVIRRADRGPVVREKRPDGVSAPAPP